MPWPTSPTGHVPSRATRVCPRVPCTPHAACVARAHSQEIKKKIEAMTRRLEDKTLNKNQHDATRLAVGGARPLLR